MENNELTDTKLVTPASTGKKVGAFIVFALAVIFCFIFIASSSFTISILNEGKGSLGDAIGSIFAVILSIPAVIISSIPMLIFNILSVVFFKRIKDREERHPTLYKAFFIFSIILLILGVAVGVLDAFLFIGN